MLAILLISTLLRRRWRLALLRQLGRRWIIPLPHRTIHDRLLGRVNSLVVIVIVPTGRLGSGLHHLPTTAEEYHEANDAKGKKSHDNADADADFLTARETEDVGVTPPSITVEAGVVRGTAVNEAS